MMWRSPLSNGKEIVGRDFLIEKLLLLIEYKSIEVVIFIGTKEIYIRLIPLVAPPPMEKKCISWMLQWIEELGPPVENKWLVFWGEAKFWRKGRIRMTWWNCFFSTSFEIILVSVHARQGPHHEHLDMMIYCGWSWITHMIIFHESRFLGQTIGNEWCFVFKMSTTKGTTSRVDLVIELGFQKTLCPFA